MSGFTPKKAGDHSTRSARLPGFDRADMGGNAMRDGGIDRVFRDIALDAEIVVVARLLRQAAALHLHLVRGLPGADDHLADAAHRLAVGGDHREGADIVQDVFRGDRLLADAAFGEGDVLGDAGSRWWQTISMSRCSAMVLTV